MNELKNAIQTIGREMPSQKWPQNPHFPLEDVDPI